MSLNGTETVHFGLFNSHHRRIGVARLDMPDILPPEGVADPPEAKI
jgi:hypothetical protein